jgi:DNA-binding XRE family transcriptional regulator
VIIYLSTSQFLNVFQAQRSLLKVFFAQQRKTQSMSTNSLKETRESMLMSKAELARQANVSPITITRVEKGMPCRIDTQRKILLALGLKPVDKHKIFKD